METEWEYLTIEPSRFDNTPDISVYGHGTYPQGSVLEGQARRTFLDSFSTVEEAKQKYPEAEVLNNTSYLPHQPLPSTPPHDFDPLDAGETW